MQTILKQNNIHSLRNSSPSTFTQKMDFSVTDAVENRKFCDKRIPNLRKCFQEVIAPVVDIVSCPVAELSRSTHLLILRFVVYFYGT